MTPAEEQSGLIATLANEMKHVVLAVDKIKEDIRELATRKELERFVLRSEFDALKDRVDRGSVSKLWTTATQIAVGVTAITAALSLFAMAVLSFGSKIH